MFWVKQILSHSFNLSFLKPYIGPYVSFWKTFNLSEFFNLL